MAGAYGEKPTGLARLKKPAVEVTVKHAGPEPDGDEQGEKEPEWDDWQLKQHAQTLQDAEEIKGNPKLMKALKPHLDKKVSGLKSLAALRKKASMLPKGE